ncbi:hypothetical protein NHQ30_006988 [Ciborinia camelliae]|nr:hypothetical protein NHQ30_006988 [Ciborinia camelliae]
MVKFISLALFVIASASAAFDQINCKDVCSKAHRADGKSYGTGAPGTPCSAGGKYQCTNAWTSIDRTPCYRMDEPFSPNTPQP